MSRSRGGKPAGGKSLLGWGLELSAKGVDQLRSLDGGSESEIN